MPILDIWIEENLKSCVNTLATRNRPGKSLSEVTRDLILVGIDLAGQGDLEITGILGTRRPFAEISFGGPPARLGLRVDQDFVQNLEASFELPARTAARNAIRLGLTALAPGEVGIVGPGGLRRPLASFELPEIRGQEAKEALERLRKLAR